MTNDGFMTAAEMKSLLGLSAQSGDNRTLNKYVKEGKLEIKPFSRKVKLYREKRSLTLMLRQLQIWIFAFEINK